MLNEVLHRRYVREVQSHGVPKYMAQEIVDTAMETSKGKDVSKYINYAMTLVYGLKFKTN